MTTDMVILADNGGTGGGTDGTTVEPGTGGSQSSGSDGGAGDTTKDPATDDSQSGGDNVSPDSAEASSINE